MNRVQNVGIKHFTSNWIQLICQADFLEKSPCLITLPVMDIKSMKNWNGKKYHAIVLAGNFEEEYETASVYRQIRADFGMLDGEGSIDNKCLSNVGKCKKARRLLRTMILCVCKSFAFNADHVKKILTYNTTLKKEYSDVSNTLGPFDANKVTVPDKRLKHDTSIACKILFDLAKSPVPDSVLLLAKSTSIWLKHQSLFILPGGNDDDSNSSNNSSDSLNFMASAHAEAVIQGMVPYDYMKSCVSEYVEIHPSSTFDKLLSYIDN
jgi:hypothetical protein